MKKGKLNKKTQVMMSVKSALEYIKERIEVDLNLDEKQIDNVKNIINLSIDTSFFKTSQSIEDAV